MSRIELPGMNGRLLVSPDAAGWSQVVLHQGHLSHALGAETMKSIVGRLIEFLSQRSPETKWVLSLSELHSSVYGEHVEGKVLLKIQNAEGKIAATLEVSSEQQTEWLAILSKWSA